MQEKQDSTKRNLLFPNLDSLPVGVFVHNKEGAILSWNRQMEQITGYQAKEVVGKSIDDIAAGINRHGGCRHCKNPAPTLPGRERTCTIETKDGRLVCVLHRVSETQEHFVHVLVDLSTLDETAPRKPAHPRVRFHGLVGKSHVMQELYHKIELAAASNATVLLTGPTGSGKELVAEAIHAESPRAEGPLVKVNCSALSEAILESELFGHVAGAFTGAIRDKIGRFELAHGGTIFLDEIGDISPTIQLKLLRVLQEREIERVGESTPRKVDVRVIAATNKDLTQLIREGKFREDLYFRLKVFPIETPALRDHREDLGLLAEHFIAHFNAETGKNITGFTESAWQAIMDYPWPGNVREFQNAIEHAFVVRSEGLIDLFDLPQEVRRTEFQKADSRAKKHVPAEGADKEFMLKLLEESGWNMAEVGRRLGINRSSVLRRLRNLGISTRPPRTKT